MLVTQYPSDALLDSLRSKSDGIASEFGTEWFELPAVGGGGCVSRPRIALVFINPTARNQSAAEDWEGQKAPFIGLSRIWRVLAGAGLISANVVSALPPDGQWTPSVASEFYEVLAKDGLYVTNLVKACRRDATLPSVRMAKAYRDLVIEELQLVQPHLVVAMGGLVATVLGLSAVSLEDEYGWFSAEGALRARQIPETSLRFAACYFPVGRGNPVRAREMLSTLAANEYVSASSQAPSFAGSRPATLDL